jgi:hypothetical protein
MNSQKPGDLVWNTRVNIQARDRRSDIIMGGYTEIPEKFYHPNAGRNALGLVGGNEVSVVKGNLVDMESDLLGITRDLSRFPPKKYQQTLPEGASWPTSDLTFVDRETEKPRQISMAPRHLPTIQMNSYPGVPKPMPIRQEVYGAPWRF